MQRWRFVNDGNGWRWQRLNGGKARVESELHKSFGSALLDALNNGFRPRTDTWTVDDDRSLSTYQPGKRPKTRSK